MGLTLGYSSLCTAQVAGDTTKTDQTASKGKQFLNKIKLSGYIQGDLQVGQRDANLNVGGKRAPGEETFTRIGIRRGRLKAAYTDKYGSAVIQIDATDKGIGLKDVYFTLSDPWIRWFTFTAGIFNRPFGDEIAYSSRLREAPERSTVFRTLFPGERDLGAMLTIQAPDQHVLHNFKLSTGLFSGNALDLDLDNRKDWISHLTYKQNHKYVTWAVGASLYLGGVYQPTDSIYVMQSDGFVRGSSRLGGYSPRQYYGIDAQLQINSGWGLTALRGEFLWGKQPGTATSTKSPDENELPANNPQNDLFRRHFRGYNLYLTQQIANSKHSIVVRYDGYNPNTQIGGKQIGAVGSNTGEADLSQQNLGFGYIFQLNKNIRMMAYYDLAFNETSPYVEAYTQHRKANVLTVRLQYAF